MPDVRGYGLGRCEHVSPVQGRWLVVSVALKGCKLFLYPSRTSGICKRPKWDGCILCRPAVATDPSGCSLCDGLRVGSVSHSRCLRGCSRWSLVYKLQFLLRPPSRER